MAYSNLTEPENTSQVVITQGVPETMSWKSSMKQTRRSVEELGRLCMRYLGMWTVQECKTRGQSWSLQALKEASVGSSAQLLSHHLPTSRMPVAGFLAFGWILGSGLKHPTTAFAPVDGTDNHLHLTGVGATVNWQRFLGSPSWQSTVDESKP